MTHVERHTMTVVMSAASGATVDSSAPLNGLLYAVGFLPSTAGGWTSNIDLAVAVRGGPDILHVDLDATPSTIEQMFWPRRSSNTTASGVIDPAGNTSGREAAMIPLADDIVRVVAASGGATTSGQVRLYLI